jgi:outer membrane autotransporter protein
MRSACRAVLWSGLTASCLLPAPTAQALCVPPLPAPVVNCSGTDAAGTIGVVTVITPTVNLIGETITGAGGPGIVIQSFDANPAHTGGYTMDAASSISVTGGGARGLWYETSGAGITVSISHPITTVGGNSIFAEIDFASTAPVSVTTFAGAPVVGRISGGTVGSGNATITTGDKVTFAVGMGGFTEGSSAIDAGSFGGGHVTVQVNAPVVSFFDGVQGVTGLGGQVDITTAAAAPVNAGRVGIIAEAELGTGTVNVTTNAPVLTTGGFANSFGIFAFSDGGNVNVTTNASVGNFGIRAFAGTSGFVTGNVTVTANADVIGNGTLGAINASTANGLLTLSVNNGATVSAGNVAADAIHAVTTGSGNIAINLAAGTIVNGGGGGIFVDQSTGSGSTLMNANGTVTGAGSTAKPIISIATSGTATLNNSGAVFSLAGLPGDLAIKETGGAATINNGGFVTGRMTAADTTFNNNNAWTVFGANTFGTATLNNPGVIDIAGTAGNGASVTSFTASGILIVNNNGRVLVSGAANFTGAAGSAFSNTGGLIDMRQSVAGDIVRVNGNFNASGNSRLGVDTFLGGAGSKSDQLFITGNVTGNTSIIVHDTNPGPGGFTGPGGIPIVTVAGAVTPANFSLNPASTVIGGSFLPINGGVLQKGLFQYMLVDDPGTFALVSVPNTALFQMPVALSAAQNIWYETAFGWEDRQLELRDYFHRGAMPARDSGVMPVKAYGPALVAPAAQPGIWLKAVGSWTDRSDTQSFSIAGASLPVDLGYKQNVYGVIGGADVGQSAWLSRNDAVAFGVMGGYVDSHLDFNVNPTIFRYSGGTAGASATYLNGGIFIDALGKVDFLRLDIEGLPTAAGIPQATVDALTWGAMGNAGFHFEYQRLFVEPLATLAYTRTSIGTIALPAAGVAVDFNNVETLRGAVGARFGGRVAENQALVIDASVVARIWDQFRGNNVANILNAGVPLALTDNFTGTFGEVTGHLDLIAKGTGLSSFLAGGVKFNHDFTTANVKAGLRYQF